MLFWIPTLELTNTGLYLLIGENECGKTTLMNILSLNDTSYQGTMPPDNMDVKKMTSHQKRKYKQKNSSYMLGRKNFISFINVKDNINIGAKQKSTIDEIDKELLNRNSICALSIY